MSKGGRPGFKITEEICAKAETLAAQGLTQDQIACCLGFSPATLYKNKAKNVEFAEAIKRGKAKGVGTITNALFNKAKSGDTTAMIFYLKNRDPDQWKDKRYNDVTTGDEPIPMPTIIGLSGD